MSEMESCEGSAMNDLINSELINVKLTDSIQRISINRPDKMNSITSPMYHALANALLAADENPQVRVIYLCAEGKHFCAGNDLTAFMESIADETGAAALEIMQPPKRLLLQLARLKKPLVIALKGMAVGIGATMVLHADIAYADTSTRFILPFINLGLTPEGGCSQLLPQRIGQVRAAELLMLGEPFSAQQAAELGLINAVCEPDELDARAWGCALKLASKPPEALRAVKAALRQNAQPPLETVICSELQLLAGRFSSPEAKEALSAFAAKRSPDFSRFR
ncbi:MAG: enoyl-CoA hydratase/carnithine racemase [Motiliproteus sp.]|jgi:enoyl-CoA hydratase/carnithine racemase